MSDKRQITTDALETLGTIISESEKRDAIHLAVEPVVAAHTLRPGEDVGFVDGGVGLSDNPVGIVDPFLKNAVQKGQKFWLVVYPRQITSLRHVWAHPKFDNIEVGSEVKEINKPMEILLAEGRLRHFASELPVHYDDLINHAREYIECGDYWIEGGRFEGQSIPDTFWTDYEIVTGTKVPDDKKWSFFSCAC